MSMDASSQVQSGIGPGSRSPPARNRASQRVPRVRACTECKRHKIRCDVKRGETSCARCLRSGIECVPYDPTQKILEENAAWKAEAQSQISQLQAAVKTLLQRERLPDLSTFNDTTSPADSALGSITTANAIITPIDDAERGASPGPHHDDSVLVPAPMTNLYELSKTSASKKNESRPARAKATNTEGDLISRGVVSLAEAERLFARYLKNHHPLIWGSIIFPYQTLQEVRQASVLLSTAVFTVVSLHSPDCAETLQRCYDAFVSMVNSSCLARNHTLDDVRALCLGAFYLPNLSYRLSGQAVRMAVELNIHHSFRKLMKGDTSQQERVRVWYALYVCDRHISIAYGRPSAMYDDASIKGVEQFCEIPSAIPGDIRVASQVALFKILTEAYLDFGGDPNEPLSEQDLEKLRKFNVEIDQWRISWQPRSLDCPGIGAYPSLGVVLYYHFARFQLNSLALRGIRWPSNEPLCLNRREAAMTAISAAMSTLVHVLVEDDMRRCLSGVPLFVHTLVAFCATFLLKMAAIWARGGDSLSQALGLGFNLDEVLSLTRRSASMLSEVSEQVSDKHLTRLIVAGIGELLQRVNVPDSDGDCSSANGVQHATTPWAEGQSQREAGAAFDFATEQMGNGGHQEMIYNMDLDSLAAFLEYGSDQTLFNEHEFGTWGGTA